VIRELAVDEPYPRTEDFRTSTGYVAHCRAASEALALAMDGIAHEG
jgi:NitT/TauT family transport system ATP-binding protein